MSIFIHNLYLRYLTSVPLCSTFRWFCKNYHQPMTVKLNMNEAILLHEEGSKTFEMLLRYTDSSFKVDRRFNFQRKVDEPINKFVERINKNITGFVLKRLYRGSKKSSIDAFPEQSLLTHSMKDVQFVKDNRVLNGDLTCKSLLEDSGIKLIIFRTEYVLKYNAPFISKIKVPSSILVNFPTYPTCFEGVNVDRSKSIFNWYKDKNQEWIHIGSNFCYIPNNLDVGCKLKLTCVPKNDKMSGPQIQVISNCIVEFGPSCPFEIRHTFTKNKLSDKSFRVTSYNILGGVYSETSLSKETLYPYCPSHALSVDYRKLLLLRELMGYNSDIICLQEVDGKIYKNDFLPFLSVLNYDGTLHFKNSLREGLAIFYNKERFDKLFCDFSVISQDTNLDEFNSVLSQIQNDAVQTTFQSRNTIIQATALRSKENPEILIVGNTHLYFRPNASHIRLLQAYYGILYLQKLAKRMKEENSDCNVSILYCGDFNSLPEAGVYQLLTEKCVPEYHDAWTSCPEERVQNVSLKHNLNLSSACGTPKYTNFTATFSGCLDYIFYQTDHLKVKQVIPMPSQEEVEAYTALPSITFPSDHISLCADFTWLK